MILGRNRLLFAAAGSLLLAGVAVAMLIPSAWTCPSGGEVLPIPEEAIEFGRRPPCSVPPGEEPVRPYFPNDLGDPPPPQVDTAYRDDRIGPRVLVGLAGASLAALVLIFGLKEDPED